MAGGEHRFAHLLQPIRDLADNWNIDIAQDLEQYLDELETLSVSIDGGTSLNFAEAALIIQGSTCVYSRKVEFLLQLVNRCLDVIADRRIAEEPSGAIDKADVDISFPEEPEFLPLDDLPEGKGIDIGASKDESQTDHPVNPRPPLLLLSLNNNKPGGSEEQDFMLASCRIHSSGAVVLDPADMERLGPEFGPRASPAPAHTDGLTDEAFDDVQADDFDGGDDGYSSGGDNGAGCDDEMGFDADVRSAGCRSDD